jgi:hypothetical protein
LLDPRFSAKDYIYEDLLGYFWWNHQDPSYIEFTKNQDEEEIAN